MNVTTLQHVELGVLGPLQVRQDGVPVTIPGAKPRAILTMLGLHGGSVVSADTLVELLWGEDPPRTAAKALQTHISSLRRTLGDGFVLTQGAGWTLADSEVDASRYKSAARLGRDAAAAGDTSQALTRFEEALCLWRGIPELPDSRRGLSEKTRWIEGHDALVEDRADALLATGRAAEVIGDLEAAVAEAPLRERRWGQLMLALYRAGRQGEALAAYQRARSLLADELGVDPGPELRRLEAAIVAQDASLDILVAQQLPSVTRAVTFLLTDIEGSTTAWEENADAMAVALARHDELVEQVITSRGGRLIKTRGEGDATFSVFERPSAAASAAIELQDAIDHEPWALREPMRVRVALHTGEVELRDGDYFGRAVNRAARLRSLAEGGQILCSGAIAELVIDSLPDDVVLTDLGMRQLRNLARAEHVFELRLETAEDAPPPRISDAPMERPGLPAVLIGSGPFVGRGHELERLLSTWETALAGGVRTALIAGEPGVGKTRLAGEWSQRAYELGAAVLYGRCDEDLGAPYQPFAEALRSLVPCVGTERLRGLRGVEALLPLVPGLTDLLPDLAAPARADPDTERYALFDAVVALLEIASLGAPIVLILDDLHWAAKPTLLLLRHVLRFGEQARVQIVGTYRSTDLDRSHPLAAMLADLNRDGTANRLSLSGLDEHDVTAYVVEAGYDDEELAHALASVTGGNPFFLIEALRHVDESGGVWDQSTLPQGVREAVSRRLSRLPADTNKALAAAAVVGSRFALELVEQVVGDELIDAFDEASKAGIVIEEPGGYYRFNHAIVRQSLLAELASVRRMRLHQRIATTLESLPGAEDELLAELAHHYFECAWAGNAAKAVFYCRRAADQAMARLAYEGAADLYDHALHALEEIDEELPDRDEQTAELLVARCEASLAAGDVASAADAVSQLQAATVDSPRLAAWATCFDGELSMLIHPERLDQVEAALGAAAEKLAGLDDAAGEAKAHTVRAGCLARLGRIGDCEIALDDALTAARRAREHRRVNNVLANAPLAALWGPNPVPRAGGRCLDVVRLLRITTDSPAVEATSTRCQAVLEAFRGRAAAARRMIDSARRTVTELGLRHALLEVEQFAGIVELVGDDPAAAEAHLRLAYNGFRRMGLDADTAETAALLGRTCLALGRDGEADELCSESERLAGNALKPSIAWRTLRARLLSRGQDHAEARRVAEAAVKLAERTDLLMDHADACLALATVLGTAGDVTGARAAAEQAVALYERKGAAALAERASHIVGERPALPTQPEAPGVELDNACVLVGKQLVAAVEREAWDEVVQLFAPFVSVESRRRIVGFPRIDLPSGQWPHEMRRYLQTGMVRHRPAAVAVRGNRLALIRIEIGTADRSSGAPQDEMLQVVGLDQQGRIALQVWFDVEDIDAALAELDAAHARFEEPHPRPPLENAASRADDRFNALFADRRWDEIGALLIDDIRVEDRRRGLRREGNDRATELAELRAIADVGTKNMTSDVLAIRGERLALVRTLYSGRDQRPEAFHTELIRIAETDADERIVAYTAFDPDDFEVAIAELETRYLTGEASAHAHTWSLIARTYAGFNRGELPTTTQDWLTVDHRHAAAMAPGEGVAYFSASWELAAELNVYIEAVHRLSDLGAVFTHVGKGTSRDGFEAEWRTVDIMTVEGDLINRCELFDEADHDTAIARFEQLSRPAPRPENAASLVAECIFSCFATRNWDAIAKVLADDVSTDDRRRTTNAGIRRGRDAEIENWQAAANVGFTDLAPTVIATRGGRLVLTRLQASGRDPQTIRIEVLLVIEIDADEQIATIVVFELDDFEVAITELDRRYLAGEAAAHARTWSVITRGYASLNRRELPPTTPDWVNVDHRRGTAFGPNEMTAYIRAAWDLSPDISNYIEAVHRLNNLGAVVTNASHGSSQEGFDAEWRGINIMTVEGDLLNRCEVFDEADIDAALTKFEQLSRPTPRLENAASQVNERFLASFAACDWATMADIMADDLSSDDRRRIVNAGLQQGRDVLIENFRSAADLGVTHATSDVIATRGKRLVLTRARYSRADEKPEPFHLDLQQIVEIDADDRITALVTFDSDDFEAALAELETRYLAGEAAAHAQTWSAITRVITSINRHEVPALTRDWVNIDHRRGRAFAPGDAIAYLAASVDSAGGVHLESVHRLSNLGAVTTYVGHGTSQEGFEAEWRGVYVLTVEGDMVNRGEVFDEGDLDAALAKFEQLSQPRPRQENTASQIADRVMAHFTAREWGAASEMLADDFSSDDRRRTVNAGIQRGRDAAMKDAHANADLGSKEITSTVIATRGERLVLRRARFTSRPEHFYVDALSIYEINGDGRVAASVIFDVEDIDAAFEELDARYLGGEGAAHAHTWSVITRAYSALNRREMLPTTPDWVNIDHRRHGTSFAPGELPALLDLWNLAPDMWSYAEVVHRLNNLGAVVTSVSHETSPDGVNAEWRGICVVTVEGELIDRFEGFDEADLDAAIAKFEQLPLQGARLENAASQAYERFWACFVARDWDAMAELLAADLATDDRRRVVNEGIRRGRDTEIASMRALTEVVGPDDITSTVIATRGERLALSRVRSPAFQTEVLNIVELETDELIAAVVGFDLEDIDAAFAELDARYVAGDAAAHAHTWSLVAAAYAGYNRRELPATTPDWVNVDRRRVTTYPTGDAFKFVRVGWNQTPDISFRIEAVHQLSNLGAVVTHAGRGTSQEDFDAEWRQIHLMTVEGDLFNRSEMFDEADLDAALTRFEELHPPARRLENAASQVAERFQAHWVAGDWDAVAGILADNFSRDDRRRVVGAGVRHGRDESIVDMRATADLWITNATSTVVATRGARLALTRGHFSGRGQVPEAFLTELLGVIEIDADERIVALVFLDPDDIDAAFQELDARYLAGEAAAHSRTWSAIARAHAGFNRHELPATTPDPVYIDHRPLTIEAVDLAASVRSVWDLMPDVRVYAETVHRLSELGAVVTQALQGISQEGFEAEWRTIELVTVEGDLISRFEIFDEADLDAALARFEELHTQTARLKNAVAERFVAHFAARDWDALGALFADDYYCDDRRRVVNAGIRHSRAAAMEDLRVAADVGLLTNITSTVIATRGERLILTRFRASGRETDAVQVDVLQVVEHDAYERIEAAVVFDFDDVDAAFEELDTRYLAGEAAVHSQTWSVITGTYAAVNRRQLPPMTQDFVFIDHLPLQRIEAGDLNALIRAMRDLTPDISQYIEAVHRLSDLGAVVTRIASGTSQEGFDAEWRQIDMFTVEGDKVNRCEVFSETDLDAALARFEELRPQARRPENAASRASDRLVVHYAARDWDAAAETLADNFCSDDRRHVVNAALRHGRDVAVANMQISADLGMTFGKHEVIATRGEHLVLSRARWSGPDQGPEAFYTEVLHVVEVDADERVAWRVMFDANDIDAAFEELDARYLAGEAARYARAWQLGMDTIGELNRHEPGPMIGRLVYADHRRVPFASGEEFGRGVEELWALVPDARYRVKAVHALDTYGSVCTLVIEGTDAHGNELQWGRIILFGSEEPRVEVYEEEDLDAALARFAELRPQTLRPENAASRAGERILAHFAARDWDAMAEMVADNFSSDDRRRVVGAGIRHGRNAYIADMRAIADLSFTNSTLSTFMAIRGERLSLQRVRFSDDRDQGRDAFLTEVLGIIEINADGRIVASVAFDPDDVDAAFEELDARYLAGEAAAYSETWSLVTHRYAALNRHELPPDRINVDDHRRIGMVEPGDPTAVLRAGWDLTPNFTIHIEAVHRLGALGAVVTRVTNATSEEGFAAEWRAIDLWTVEGDLVTRCEIFDEANLDAALARFEERQPQARQPENAASQQIERLRSCFATRDWAEMAELMADDVFTDDRRRIVGAGSQYGRDADIANMRALTSIGVTNMASTVIATRGARLALSRARLTGRDQRPEAFHTEVLDVVEINADNRIAAHIAFEPNDIDAAFEELDARYLAGEAAAHPQTWSVIAGIYAAIDRHELPATTPDWINIDHRPLAMFKAGDLAAYLGATWDLTPDIRDRIEAVHRLSDLGAVVTYAAHGTSQQGVNAEWRGISLLTVEGDLINRCEIFDDQDIDAALARFDELDRPAPVLENAATRAWARVADAFNRRDVDGVLDLSRADGRYEDRRKGLRDVIEGPAGRKNVRVSLETAPSSWRLEVEPIAVRGARLSLIRGCYRDVDDGDRPIVVEFLNVIELDDGGRIQESVSFDPNDIDAAFEDLDARYLAGEAAAHAHTWSVIARTCTAFNRHELPATTTPDWVHIDHRRGTPFPSSDLTATIRAASSWDLAPDLSIHIEVVHRVSAVGAVVTQTAHGTSHEGFDAEWRMIALLTVEGDGINRSEIFDEADIDVALARFEELNRPAPRLENTASQTYERYGRYFAARDWAAMAELLTADTYVIDHRQVVNSGIRRGSDVEIANMQAIASVGAENIMSTVVGTRGARLALCRTCISGQDQPGALRIEFCSVVEIDADERIVAALIFDLDDIDAAYEELDARYLAGEAAADAHTWSVITRECAAFNRHELDELTAADYVTIDHRALAIIDAADPQAAFRAIWDVTPDLSIRIEAVHQLSGFGAVATYAAYGNSPEGFGAEWRMIFVLTVEGDRINRCEIFDETDIDAALARFNELRPEAPRPKNAATQLVERFGAYFAARNWAALAEISADEILTDDRRSVVSSGILRGRDLDIANIRATADVGVTHLTTTVIATRGERLALVRGHLSGRDQRPEAFQTELLNVLEIDADNRFAARILFDPDDIDAAFAELDARYIAGEAAAHAHTWSVITQAYAAFNRHELPSTTPDSVYIDHRPLVTVEAVDLDEFTRATWDVTPDASVHIEAVHSLSDLGAVVTNTARGVSHEDFDAEWRMIHMFTVDGDLISRCEIFDEADLEAAVGRFEELQPQARRLQNAATQLAERFVAHFASRDWAAMTELLTDDTSTEDRRRVVNAGNQHGRDLDIANMRAIADLGVSNIALTTIATRGERLALSRARMSGRDQRPEAFYTETLSVLEIDRENRAAARVIFDLDDIDAAFEELDRRYLAGEAAAHAHTWLINSRLYAGFNRHELPATTPDWIYIDHRPLVTIESNDLPASVRAVWDLTPDMSVYMEAVHRLSDLGAVVTFAVYGSSPEDFAAEWRMIDLFTVEGDLINRCEIFDEADLDAALATFDELDRPAPAQP